MRKRVIQYVAYEIEIFYYAYTALMNDVKPRFCEARKMNEVGFDFVFSWFK
jgi:hypothetical protein